MLCDCSKKTESPVCAQSVKGIIRLCRFHCQRWDRSHLLENLSGMETSCAMINTAHWPFAHARQEARQRSMRVEGAFGSSRNKGDTTRAIIDVLIGWDLYHEKVRGR